MIKQGKTIYYTDETNDDFFKQNKNIKLIIDGKYKYLHNNFLYNFFSFIVYYLIAIPFLVIVTQLVLGVKVNGKKNLKHIKTGYILYSNHTHALDCVVSPVRLVAPRRAYIISNKNAVNIPVVKILTKTLGSLPVADTIDGLKNLNKAISTLLKKKKALIIYPEAHVWQYYTGIRPFPSTSFKYAIFNNVPVVPVAITYRQRKILKNRPPKMCAEIGSPIYCKPELSNAENVEYLRNSVYNFIKQKVESKNNYNYYNYVKVSPEQYNDIANK